VTEDKSRSQTVISEIFEACGELAARGDRWLAKFGKEAEETARWLIAQCGSLRVIPDSAREFADTLSGIFDTEQTPAAASSAAAKADEAPAASAEAHQPKAVKAKAGESPSAKAKAGEAKTPKTRSGGTPAKRTETDAAEATEAKAGEAQSVKTVPGEAKGEKGQTAEVESDADTE
jgi:hypothetical protein